MDRMTNLVSELRSAINEARAFKNEMETWFSKAQKMRELNITGNTSIETITSDFLFCFQR